jgi:2-oxoglutarate ferredoxin oxidoreductase subunit gamma
MEKNPTEIRFAGFGGQGIIRSGYLIGKAASLHDGKFATLNQAFGPEARGGACSAQVLIAQDRVLYPYITKPDILVTMSQEAYEKYGSELGDRGMLITDTDLVKTGKVKGKVKHYSIPATRFAEELGNRIIANVVMIGFFTAITEVVSKEAMKKAIPGSVPDRFLELNLKAFEQGYTFGKQLIQ